MAILAFLASVLYWPGIAGAATTPRWALLFLIVPWLVRRQDWTAAHVVGLLLIAWAALSLAWTPVPVDGIGSLFIIGLLAQIFCLGNQIEDMRPVYVGAGIAVAISGVVAAVHVFGVDLVRGVGTSGLFVNQIFLGETAALILVAAMVERMWWLAALMGPTLVISGARGAILAGAIALAVYFRGKRLLAFGIIAVAGVAIVEYTLDRNSICTGRCQIWESTLYGLTPFGHGIGSFWTDYPQFVRGQMIERPEFAHNEWLHVAFELGLPGLLLFCLWCFTMTGPLDTARLVLITLAVESCFAFPIHIPATAFIGMLAAGHAVRSRFTLLDFAMYRRRINLERMART